MKKYILKNKNQITFINSFLITLAFIIHFIFKVDKVPDYLLIVASVLGVAPILIQAVQALIVKVVSIELLVTIAVFGAFLIGNYQESSVVTFLFLFGTYLEQKTIAQTRSAIKELTDLVPNTALIRQDDETFKELDIDFVDVGDVLLVKTGARVPVDGRVISGHGYIDESSITGEVKPISKKHDDYVYAGTILDNGTIHIIADKVGEDTTFGKIIELVEEAQDTKSDTERFIDKFSRYYTPLVLVVSLIIYVITKNVELSITILVLGCPGALVIGVPVSNVSGIGNGARNGILLKGSEVIHDFSNIDTFVFDKTGTLTKGKPEVSKLITYTNDNDVLNILASIESESEHPLGKSILAYIGEYELKEIISTEVIKGKGIKSNVEEKRVLVGNYSLLKHNVNFSTEQLTHINELEKNGNSIVLMSIDEKLVMMLGIKDQIKDDVSKTLDELRELGIKKLIMLSGDNQGSVDVVSKELELTEAHGNMLPQDKSDYIKKLQNKNHTVAFVGDGINDSPSLTLADIGIAVGNGTDIAIETSDVVLIGSSIDKLSYAYTLSKKTILNMKENILVSIGVVFILITSLLFSN
ncbi:cadmium-translocating P-type ATPase [Vagococcus lutrae LBD1]|uniref:Cd(2+)-exporting ATPase n=1 Tax=Vagococcus lutrae LBD1 TaxID=1408226 RepID=V6QBD6_9ENTE|nr:cadmium-translocating P-type ATPase [Vagococcus lutrae LBD1]